MGLTQLPKTTTLYSEARLTWLLEAVDELHTAVSDGELAAVTSLNELELQNWLRELVWVAQEALAEMECQRAQAQPALALVRKSS
jgi:hypothetical protein